MLDYQDYTIQTDHYQGNGNGNGYSHLQGDWLLFYKVAKGFTHRVPADYRQDFLHDVMLTMAKVKAKYDVIGKPMTEAGLIRVACYEVADYWRKQFKRTRGMNCGNCSKARRDKCRDWDLYRECPKAIKLESLDRIIEDGEGNEISLYQMIADDNAVDITARLEARFILQSYPHRFVKIAYKKYAGYPLTTSERNYLYKHRRKALQKRLSLV